MDHAYTDAPSTLLSQSPVVLDLTHRALKFEACAVSEVSVYVSVYYRMYPLSSMMYTYDNTHTDASLTAASKPCDLTTMTTVNQ